MNLACDTYVSKKKKKENQSEIIIYCKITLEVCKTAYT